MFPATLTVVDGTGRFAGIAIDLHGEFRSKVVDIDAATRIVNRGITGEFTGQLPSSRE